jgi:YbbR domain-containing protein
MYHILYKRNHIQYNVKLYFIVKVNKKTIEKLLRTNSQIISKLEVLITGQKNLETRLSSIEKKLNNDNKNNNNTIDPEYIKVIKMNII